jgi:hypothetical protein
MGDGCCDSATGFVQSWRFCGLGGAIWALWEKLDEIGRDGLLWTPSLRLLTQRSE